MDSRGPSWIAGRMGRWTPARLLVVGAALGFVPVVLDAYVVLVSNLAALDGSLSPVPYWAVLLDVSLLGLAAPAGLFLALSGLLLHVRSKRPPGRSRAFRIGFGGAGLNLAAGLQLGLLNFSFYLLPSGLLTLDFVRNAVLVIFLSTVVAGLGLLLALAGIAALVREVPTPETEFPAIRVRMPRGKSIYRGDPSAR